MYLELRKGGVDMGRQVTSDRVYFYRSRKSGNDTLDEENLIVAVMSDMPLFYFWPEGQNVPDNPGNTCGTSADNAYQDLLEERAQEPEPEDVEDDDPFGLEPVSEEACLAVADRDIDWMEYDMVEDEFDLSNIEDANGFTIIVFPTSVLLLTNDCPTDEEQILDGFDLQKPDVPKIPIYCQAQFPS